MSNDGSSRISAQQNTTYSLRLLAAQSRLYTDAKRIHDFRVLSVVLLSLATAIVAMMLPNIRVAIGTLGGAVTFFWSILASEKEKRCIREAVCVQEDFDTRVFKLPWNKFAADHPSPTVVAEAASRYRGSRIKDWYPDTKSVTRPLDILICQRSNLGWGASTHRFYANFLVGTLVLLSSAGLAIAMFGKLSVTDALIVVLIPFLGPAREILDMIRSNRESADSKTRAEAKILSLWRHAIEEEGTISIAECRAIQDQILNIRQGNAHVPDWLDKARRRRNENAMQESAAYMIEEAIASGRTDDSIS